jgi:hypothetical protein
MHSVVKNFPGVLSDYSLVQWLENAGALSGESTQVSHSLDNSGNIQSISFGNSLWYLMPLISQHNSPSFMFATHIVGNLQTI